MDKLELIQNLEAEMRQAMQQGDTQKMEKLIHNEMLFTIPGGSTVTKKDDLKAYSQGQMQVNDIELLNQDIKQLAQCAIVISGIKMSGSYYNHSFSGLFTILRVWQFNGSHWQIIAGSSTSVEA